MTKAASRLAEPLRRSYRRSSYMINFWVGLVLVVGAIAYMAWRIGVQSERPVTSQEEAVGELLALIGGIAGSYMASRSALRSHARSAFRRLLSMYDGLGEIARMAEDETPEDRELALAKISGIARVHYRTASDALQDWSDLAPQQVAELQESLMHGGKDLAAGLEVEVSRPLVRSAVSAEEGTEHDQVDSRQGSKSSKLQRGGA